ncbi:MAG: nitrogenase molybdenum-iron protein NifN [Clostridia bacterium]|nr:nitrogenase molybdenum-iron protein NifN [Clostridia bacterium]
MLNETFDLRSVNENPCNMCMPLGGILALKGIEKSMVIVHGSQGCATYMRRHIAEHFNEPIDVGSSSLNEKGTVYGGEENLKTGLDNIIKVYRPKLVGVLTTCLAETIGEDIDRVTLDFLRERGLIDFPVVTVATPGYGGTQFEGYWLTTRKVIENLAQKTEKHSKINVIVPNISPVDIREIKRILQLMKVDYTLVPDFSDTLDQAFLESYKRIPDGGTKLEDIVRMPGALATIQMGITVEDAISPGHYLEREFDVPLYKIPLPMGIESTDIFINTVKEISGNPVPDVLKKERGRLLDCMIDSHKYNAEGKSVIFGEPELVFAVARTCMENGIYTAVVATGSTKTTLLEGLLKNDCSGLEEPYFLRETDFSRIRILSRQKKVNIAIGHSDGRYITEKEGIPLVRIGFPIHDRIGGQRLLSVGYVGTIMFLDRVTNTLLENKQRTYRSSMYEKFYCSSQKQEQYPLEG